MFEVSGLSMGDLPYEEYIPSTEELHLLKRDAPRVYEIYWEVLCHFHVCAQVIGWRLGQLPLRWLGGKIELSISIGSWH